MQKTDNAIKNAKVGLILQVLTIIVQFACRTVFIKCLAEEYLGVNGIFINILNILQLVELGFGQSFACNLYKPLKDKNDQEIAAIMQLFKKIYTIVACVIGIVGLQIVPFLKYIVADIDRVPHITVYYILTLAGVVGQYLCVYNSILIEADQKQYITQLYSKGSNIIKNIVQMIELWMFKSFLGYIIVQVIFDIGQNVALYIKANKMYHYQRVKSQIDPDIKKKIFSDQHDIVFHKISGVLMNYTDTIILQSMLGLTACALYSNYQLIQQNLAKLIRIPLEQTRAGFGHLAAEKDSQEKSADDYENRLLDLQFIDMFIFGLAQIGMFVCFNHFINIWAGSQYVFQQSVVFWIVATFYIEGIRQPVIITKEQMGLFHSDRYLGIVTCVMNIILSIIFVKMYGTGGVFAGQAISLAVTGLIVQPLILYRQGLHKQSRNYWIISIEMFIVMIAQTWLIWQLSKVITGDGIISLIAKAVLCVIVYTSITALTFKKQFKSLIKLALKAVRK